MAKGVCLSVQMVPRVMSIGVPVVLFPELLLENNSLDGGRGFEKEKEKIG